MRPEILFGTADNPATIDDNDGNDEPAIQDPPAPPPPAPINPQSALLSNLSALLRGSAGAGTTGKPEDAMRDAFRRVLKLYGMQAEMAENAAQAAENKGKYE